jgi:hypothetical protein
MVETVEAVFDGEVLRPDTPLHFAINSRVRITVELLPKDEDLTNRSFLKTAKSLQLEGPTDWSIQLDEYLYDKPSDE